MQRHQPTRNLFVAATTVASLTCSTSVWADYVWLQRENGATVARVGELGKPLAPIPTLLDVRGVQPDGKTTSAEVQANHLVLVLRSNGDVRLTATRADSNGVLTYFQARSGRSETKAVNDLELVPTTPGGNTFQLYFKGHPTAASLVNAQTTSGWRKTLTPAQDGTVTLDTPIPGLYVLEISARVNNGNVTLDGKKYEDVRYTATLSFEVTP